MKIGYGLYPFHIRFFELFLVITEVLLAVAVAVALVIFFKNDEIIMESILIISSISNCKHNLLFAQMLRIFTSAYFNEKNLIVSNKVTESAAGEKKKNFFS